MNAEEVIAEIEALEPEAREIVLQFLDLLLEIERRERA